MTARVDQGVWPTPLENAPRVFIHTGGLPGLFGHPIAEELSASAVQSTT